MKTKVRHRINPQTFAITLRQVAIATHEALLQATRVYRCRDGSKVEPCHN